MIIGAVKVDVGFNQRPTVASAIELLTKGIRVGPCLVSGSPGSTKAGLRLRTPDGCSIIGPIPGWEGICIGAGHNRNGLLLSAITGHIISAYFTT